MLLVITHHASLPEGLLLIISVLPDAPHDHCHSCGEANPSDGSLGIDRSTKKWHCHHNLKHQM